MKNRIFLVVSVLFLFSCGYNHQQKIDAAKLHLEQGDIEKAESLLLDVYASEPENVNAIETLVAAAEVSGATAKREQWCEELLKFRPWSREANIVVGKKLMREGNVADAVSRFMLALQESEFKNEKAEIQELIQKAYQKSRG